MPSTTNFATVLQGMPQPYLVLDAALIIVGASDAYLALTSRARDDIVGRHILEAFPENPDAAGTVEQGPLEVSLQHVLATGKPHEMGVIQYDIPQPGGGFSQRFWTPVHTPVIGGNGHIEYIIQNPMDVTENVLQAREADARLRVAMHAADLASWEYEPETDIWRRSHAVDELFGFAPGSGGPVAEPYFARMHPADFERVQSVISGASNSPDQTILNFDYRIIVPEGEMRYVSARGEILRTSNGKVRMIGVMMDVTSDRLRETALADALATQGELLRQKDALLAEVNHRVKNSLQLVVSTLRLQARRLTDQASIGEFRKAISRIRAIISVHEGLYRDNRSLTLDMAEHLRKLCFDVVGDATEDLLELDLQPIELSPERAIPLSVVVNELLVTAADSRVLSGARSHVSLAEVDGKITLSVALPTSDIAISNPEDTLAKRLVASMVQQVDGTLLQQRLEGSDVTTISFQRGDV